MTIKTSISIALLLFAQSTFVAAYDNPMSNTGKNCIEVEGKAVEQRSQAGVFEHKVTATNHCDAPMAVGVCYQGTSRCTRTSVGAGGQRTSLLGVKHGQSTFSFSYGWEASPY